MDLGSFKIDDVLAFYVQAMAADGSAIDADAAPTYRVYERETGTPILTGTMALLDASNTDGLYSEEITLSAANGLEDDKSYCIRVAGAVDSISGAALRTFRMKPAPATAAALTVVDDFLDTEIAAIKAKTDNLPSDPADASDVAAAFVTVGSKLDTIDDFLDTEIAAIKAKTDNLPASPAAVGSAMTLTSAYDFAKGTVAMTEAYAANGVAPTPVQLLFGVQQFLTMNGPISGTSWPVYKLDGVTLAYTCTLSSSSNPLGNKRL